MKQLHRVFFLFIFLPISALCCPESTNNEKQFIEPEIRGYSTTLDSMERTDYVIKKEYSSFRLRKVPDDFKDRYIFGVYSYASFVISLYPNYEYTIFYTCDMCGGGELLEFRTWVYNNSIVKFIANYEKDQADFIGLEFFIKTHGDYKQLNFFIKEKGNHIGDSILLSNTKLDEVKNDKNVYEYLTKNKYYTDWKAHLENDKKMKYNKSLNSTPKSGAN